MKASQFLVGKLLILYQMFSPDESLQLDAEELPVRLAHRVKELDELPYNLSEMPSIRKVKNWYAQSFEVGYSALFIHCESPLTLTSRFITSVTAGVDQFSASFLVPCCPSVTFRSFRQGGHEHIPSGECPQPVPYQLLS